MIKNLLLQTCCCLTFLLAVTSAELVFRGTCPDNIKVVNNFNVEKYLGKWYEYAKYPTYFEVNGKCNNAEYTLGENGLVNVLNSMVNEKTNAYEDIVGNATLVDNGKLLVEFPVSPAVTVSSNYWVLDTDYNNYSVVYSCNPISAQTHTTTVWILTREAIPEPTFVKKAVQVLINFNISLNELKITNQISCSDKCD